MCHLNICPTGKNSPLQRCRPSVVGEKMTRLFVTTLGNYAKNSSIMEVHQQCLYLSTPALIDLMNCPKFPLLSSSFLFLVSFLKDECPNLKIPLLFYLESFVRSNKSHNILAPCLPDVFKYLQNLCSPFLGLQIQYLDLR